MAKKTKVTQITAVLILLSHFAVANPTCPEDSLLEENQCKCVYPCPAPPNCTTGQQAIPVIKPVHNAPGKCCSVYKCQEPRDSIQFLKVEDDHVDVQCIDETGVPHANGTNWKNGPCVDCTCNNGRNYCQATFCKTCKRKSRQILLENECCPHCLEDLGSSEEYQCQSGEECSLECQYGYALDSYNCSTCACAEITPPIVNVTFDGCQPIECHLQCEFGLLVDENDCAICQCKPREQCPSKFICTKYCADGYKTNKKGCPSCRCRSSCIDQRNTSHPEGTYWMPDPCTNCTCENGGKLTCKETVCQVGCDNPMPAEQGKCCPTCPLQMPIYTDWTIYSLVLIVTLSIFCALLMGHIICSRFRARLSPVAAYPPQYYKCLPIHEPAMLNSTKAAQI